MPTIANTRNLTDTELVAVYERGGAAIRKASKAWEPVVVESFRRAVLAVFPDAARVSFSSDTWDNGVFLTVENIVDASGSSVSDDPSSDLDIDALLADLTDVWDVYAPDFELTV
jgi:hypothetical protein